MKMVVESMEMAPEAIPHPGRALKQRLLSPETGLRWWRHCRTFRGSRLDSFRVFALEAIYRRKGDVGGRPRGPHHGQARPRGDAPPHGVAALVPSSVSSLDSVYVTAKYGLWALFRPIPRIFSVQLF
jgi:hypothetical protein